MDSKFFFFIFLPFLLVRVWPAASDLLYPASNPWIQNPAWNRIYINVLFMQTLREAAKKVFFSGRPVREVVLCF